MVPYNWLGGMVASDKEVAMVTWTQLLTFVLVTEQLAAMEAADEASAAETPEADPEN